jgi:protein-L-isoaspartate(D-aspartate) O-methyltransferase
MNSRFTTTICVAAIFAITLFSGCEKKVKVDNSDLDMNTAIGSTAAPTEQTEVQKKTNTVVFDVGTRTTKVPLTNKDEYIAYMLANASEVKDFSLPNVSGTAVSWIAMTEADKKAFFSKRWDCLQIDAAMYPNQTSDRVKDAFLRTPREVFGRWYNKDWAYDTYYHGIEDGQTISGPLIVIRMTETINPTPDMKVLEIGMGSGYQSSFLAQLSNHVFTIEIKKNLYGVTSQIYDGIKEKMPEYKNVTRKNDDGYYGWEEYAPFDRIIVTCGIDHIPPALLQQLAVGGIMVIPVGPMAGQQVLLKITKEKDAEGNVTLKREDVYGGKMPVSFVPFTDSEGKNHSSPEK